MADEGNDRTYSLGGVNHQQSALYYTVSTDKWSSMPSLKYASYDNGCGIIRKRTTGNSLLILTGVLDANAQYYDLTSGSQWIKLATQDTKSNRVSIVAK